MFTKKPYPLFTSLLLATLTCNLQAQQNPCLNRTVAVNVVTENGDFVEGLSAQDFRGKLRGKQVETVTAIRDVAPRRVVMVLHASREVVIPAARGLLDVAQDGSFALITFSGTTIDFTGGRKRILDALAQLELPVHNGTRPGRALRDALVAALDLLRPAQFGDAIFLVSDGYDSSSTLSDSQLKKALDGTGVRVFALAPVDHLMISSHVTIELPGGPEWLRGLVTTTGGDFTILVYGTDTADGTGNLTKSGEQIMQFATVGFANEITGFYRVTVKLPETLNKPRDWEFKVVDANGKVNNHWRIIYPHQLAACP